ncbi:MAG TPA: hypothetical protein VML01_10825 [Bryobacterales bacterium]|nr:hypothetical protein [Bryobacterales bacterium]
MRILRRLLIGIPVLCLALILTTGLVAKFMLSGKLRDDVLSIAQSRLPVAMEIESADFSLLQWLLLRPAVAVQGLTLGNAPGFPSEHIFEASTAKPASSFPCGFVARSTHPRSRAISVRSSRRTSRASWIPFSDGRGKRRSSNPSRSGDADVNPCAGPGKWFSL